MERKDTNVVGHNVEKVDALALACGGQLFTDDFPVPDALTGALLYSPHAHARITRLDVSKAEALPGVHVVLWHGNVPRVLHTTAGQGAPEPSPYDTALFDNKVRYVGDRVAAVAAETPEIARRALGLIEVEYEVLEPVFDARTADAPGAPVIHDEEDAWIPIPVAYEPKRNLVAIVDVEAGDVEAALAGAHLRLETEVETHYAQHCPIEPHTTVAWVAPDGRVIIRSSTQVPFHARRISARICGVPEGRIRVIKPRIGGGFGAKQEVLLEPICAMLALRTGRPVAIRLTRAEELVSSRTRHPAITRLRAGFDPDGKAVAFEMRVRLITGAYGSHGLTVLTNCGSKVLPLYPCADVAFRSDTVYTTQPVAGAYRGYGATQASFAMETLMDEAAQRLGLDPVELRVRNHIREGQTSPVFRLLGEGTEGVEQVVGSCGLAECLEKGAAAIGWWDREARKAEVAAPYKRGYGMATFMQGSSIPFVDMASASLKMNEDGSFNLLLGATDLGTGSDTVLGQCAAEVLGVPLERIIVYSSDTDLTPFDVGAYASSTTYLSGQAVRNAAGKVAEQICEAAAELLDVPNEGLVLADEKVTAPDGRSVSLAEVGSSKLYESNQAQIAAFGSATSTVSPPPFAACFAEIDVDTETGKVFVRRYVMAVDCGTAIHPKLAEGQCEGAALNGLSYALTERFLFSPEGRVRNASFRDYKIFGTRDLPEMTTILVPTYEPTGPFGAKSVSEICINGPIPVLSNAIYDAVGVRLKQSPFTPEAVLAALDAVL